MLLFCVAIVAAFAKGFDAVVSVKPPPKAPVLAVGAPIDSPPKPILVG